MTLNVGANGEAVSASNPALTITIPAGQLTADSSAIAVSGDVSTFITAVSEDAVAGSVGSLENLTFDGKVVLIGINDTNYVTENWFRVYFIRR